MSADEDIDSLLKSQGFDTPAARRRARVVLEEASLTRAGKTRISREKLPRVLTLLDRRLTRACAACRSAGLASAAASPDVEIVEVTPRACPVCGSKEALRATIQLVRDMTAAGLRKLLIVGGTPMQHEEIRRLFVKTDIELRLIDGTSNSHSQPEARGNLKWADVCAIWGPTPLSHKVSTLYSSDKASALRVMVAHRGLASLLETIRLEVEKKRTDGRTRRPR